MARQDKNAKQGAQNSGQAPNPVQLQKYLGGLDYPVSKQDIVKTAQAKGADEAVMKTLDQLPDHEYKSPVEISREVGRLH